jgi:lipoprotein-releasing system permease protein
MEKYRDIAVLMSMGARREQIRRILMLQGVPIGVVGSAIGLVANSFSAQAAPGKAVS